jgi:hypothetical protein
MSQIYFSLTALSFWGLREGKNDQIIQPLTFRIALLGVIPAPDYITQLIRNQLQQFLAGKFATHITAL